MTKRLSVVVGEYTKDGVQKAEWQNIGVLAVDKNGNEYILLDPSISIAGLLAKQNVLAQKRNEAPRDMVMTKVFEDNNQNNNQNNNQAPQQQGYQQAQQQNQGGFNNQGQQQNGFNNR